MSVHSSKHKGGKTTVRRRPIGTRAAHGLTMVARKQSRLVDETGNAAPTNANLWSVRCGGRGAGGRTVTPSEPGKTGVRPEAGW